MRIADIAPVIGTSKFYLERVVKELNRNGLLKSAKGRGGGITKIDRTINLQDIMVCFYDIPVFDLNKTSGIVNQIFFSVMGVTPIYEEAPEIVKMREMTNKKQQPKVEVRPEESKEVQDIDLSSW